MTENQLSKIVFQSALKIHRNVGPGLLEKVYEECLFYELISQDLEVQRQKSFPFFYDGELMDIAFRVDLIIEDKLIVEVKAVEDFCNIHFLQLRTYLKITGCKLGMLINFNVPLIKDGVRRVVLNL
jgi:GxxExxY protein